MIERVRYVTRRLSPSGIERWYWQRPGHKLVRLPANRIERIAQAERLNAAADAHEPAALERGSIGWVTQKYRDSDRFHDLKPGTLKYYRRFLRNIESLGPALPFATFTRRAVVDFIETYPKPHQRRQCAAVLKQLFNTARYYGVVTVNEAERLGLRTGRPRDRLWTPAEIAAWTSAAAREDVHMLTAFMLLQHTAQRPGDVLAMTWANVSATGIRVRQEKTQTLLEVPCHPDLQAHIDGLRRDGMLLVSYRGRAVPYLRFNERFRRICAAAQVTSQARDLRRTAMVRLAEAGATIAEIAAISGHSIEATTRILETYLPRNRQMAANAVAKLIDYQKSR